MKTIVLAWRNIWRNRRRSILSATAIAVATMSIVLLFALLEGMKQDMRRNLTTFYTGEVQLRHPEYRRHEHLSPLHLAVENSPEVANSLADVAGVGPVVERLTVPGAVFLNDERLGLQAVGVDFGAEGAYSSIGDYVVAGDLEAVQKQEPRSNQGAGPRVVGVLAGNGVPERLGLSVGDEFTLVARTARRGTNAMTFRIAAVADFPVPALNEGAFWAPLPDVRRLAGLPDAAGEVLARLVGDRDRAAVLADIRAATPELEVRHFSEMETTYAFIRMAGTAYNFIGLFFFLLASTVIVNTTMMVIFERRREIGTLAALGMRDGELIRLFFAEALMIGALGASGGLALGTGIGAVLGRTGIDMSAAMEGVEFELSSVLYPVLNLHSTLLVFAVAVAVSGLTSYIPTRRITRIEPVAALREE